IQSNIAPHYIHHPNRQPPLIRSEHQIQTCAQAHYWKELNIIHWSDIAIELLIVIMTSCKLMNFGDVHYLNKLEELLHCFLIKNNTMESVIFTLAFKILEADYDCHFRLAICDLAPLSKVF
ncbi:hypothetical protein ACJX0J_018446, partial [Zea mays]